MSYCHWSHGMSFCCFAFLTQGYKNKWSRICLLDIWARKNDTCVTKEAQSGMKYEHLNSYSKKKKKKNHKISMSLFLDDWLCMYSWSAWRCLKPTILHFLNSRFQRKWPQAWVGCANSLATKLVLLILLFFNISSMYLAGKV